MKKLNFMLAILALLTGVSCTDFLDRESNYKYDNDDDKFFQNDAAVNFGVTGLYESVYFTGFQENNETLPWYVLFDHYTGMGIERTENNSIGAGVVDASNGFVLWGWRMPYTTISRANALLDGAEIYAANYTDLGRSRIAEAKVLKAWAYYHLAFIYGDAVIYKKRPKTVAEHNTPKSSQKEVVDYALELLNEAIPVLKYNTKTTEAGRVDKAAALGIKARIALNAGSLNIGGEAAKYFEMARAASDEVINQSGRSLNPDFEALFDRDGQMANANNELMFQLMYSNQGKKKTHYVALGHASRMYGQSGRFPTQMFVDQFECKDGKRIDESPLYNPQKPTENRDNRLKWTVWSHGDTVVGNSGGNKIKFVYDVYRDSVKFYQAKTESYAHAFNRDVSGGVAPYGPVRSGVGYIWKKYLHADKEDIFQFSNNIVLMRYAEVLLTYAEAKIELNQLDASVYEAINQVRRRAGQPDIDAERVGNRDKMQQLVRRERKVELMLEGLHWFDMRRWKTGDLENEEPTYGYPNAVMQNNMTLKEGGYEHATPDMVPNFKKTTRHDLNDIPSYAAYATRTLSNGTPFLRMRDPKRTWHDRLYQWPIPREELERNSKLQQNPLFD